jgi:prevent-host-death family protein
MNIPVKELRTQPGRVLSLVRTGVDVTITYRGKPTAKLIPIEEPKEVSEDDFFVGFGIFKDREDMASPTAFVEKMRRGHRI